MKGLKNIKFLKVFWKVIIWLAEHAYVHYLSSCQMEKAWEGTVIMPTLTSVLLLFPQFSFQSIKPACKWQCWLPAARYLCLWVLVVCLWTASVFWSSAELLQTQDWSDSAIKSYISWDFSFLLKYSWALPEHAQKAFSYHWCILSDLRILLISNYWKSLFRL